MSDIFLMKNIQNGFSSHQLLCELENFIHNSKSDDIILDFTNVDFVASNLFAVLGCIFGEYRNRKRFRLIRIKPKLQIAIKKTGFNQDFLGIESLPDKYNTIIPYKIFEVTQLVEYERYLTIKLFNRNDLPIMSKGVSDNIQDYLLELFRNVRDHTESELIYTCGQYFPKSKMLFFTIVDYGKTIYENVAEYHIAKGENIPDSCLKWAVGSGNTTCISDKPRGIGLYLIEDFVKENEGSLFIVSDNETYEISKKKYRILSLKNRFPGTIVTLGFNLSDKAIHYLKSEKNSEIEF